MSGNKKPKIALATHAFDSVDFDAHFNQMYSVAHWVALYDLYFIGRKGLHAADARNIITDEAIEQGCEYLFVLDADHLITKSTLPLLMENKDEAMVAGLICKKLHPYPQVVWLKCDDGRYIEFTLPLDGNLAEVGLCPFGCTLINLEKIQKLEKPYFRDTCRRTASGEMKNFRSDINLSEAFRANGEKVWVDTRVLVGHLGGRRAVYPQNAGAWQRCDELIEELTNLRIGMSGDCNGLIGVTK